LTDLKRTLGFYPETENKIIAWKLDSESERVMDSLGQNKWNIWTTPPPISMIPKWRVFAPSRRHHCLRGGGGDGLIVSFYSVQDCGLIGATWTLNETQ